MVKKKEKDTPVEIEGNLFLESLKLDGIQEIYVGNNTCVGEIPAETPSLTQNAPPAASKTEAAAKPKPKASKAELEKIKEKMIALRDQALKCTKCQELSSTRTHVVFGSGNIRADLMFVGEAPGRDEDQQGLPFVGRAGQLLTKIIESIGLERKHVFIANTLKCRPPKNRPPKPDEIENCNHFLMEQIKMIQPKIICALGKFAAQTVLNSETPISRLRGKFHDFNGIPLMPTYHPAYLLRNPSEKKTVWADMKLIRDELVRLKS